MRPNVVLLLTLGLALADVVSAHHPPLMERCEALTFTGKVERVEWVNPHVELIVRADDGESHRLTWLNMYQLGRVGIDVQTLQIGDEVIVTVGTRDDMEPMLLSAITRTRDGWEWSQVPQGC